jgi:hypothetical protein
MTIGKKSDKELKIKKSKEVVEPTPQPVTLPSPSSPEPVLEMTHYSNLLNLKFAFQDGNVIFEDGVVYTEVEIEKYHREKSNVELYHNLKKTFNMQFKEIPRDYETDYQQLVKQYYKFANLVKQYPELQSELDEITEELSCIELEIMKRDKNDIHR